MLKQKKIIVLQKLYKQRKNDVKWKKSVLLHLDERRRTTNIFRRMIEWVEVICRVFALIESNCENIAFVVDYLGIDILCHGNISSLSSMWNVRFGYSARIHQVLKWLQMVHGMLYKKNFLGRFFHGIVYARHPLIQNLRLHPMAFSINHHCTEEFDLFEIQKTTTLA